MAARVFNLLTWPTSINGIGEEKFRAHHALCLLREWLVAGVPAPVLLGVLDEVSALPDMKVPEAVLSATLDPSEGHVDSSAETFSETKSLSEAIKQLHETERELRAENEGLRNQLAVDTGLIEGLQEKLRNSPAPTKGLSVPPRNSEVGAGDVVGPPERYCACRERRSSLAIWPADGRESVPTPHGGYIVHGFVSCGPDAEARAALQKATAPEGAVGRDTHPALPEAPAEDVTVTQSPQKELTDQAANAAAETRDDGVGSPDSGVPEKADEDREESSGSLADVSGTPAGGAGPASFLAAGAIDGRWARVADEGAAYHLWRSLDDGEAGCGEVTDGELVALADGERPPVEEACVDCADLSVWSAPTLASRPTEDEQPELPLGVLAENPAEDFPPEVRCIAPECPKRGLGKLADQVCELHQEAERSVRVEWCWARYPKTKPKTPPSTALKGKPGRKRKAVSAHG